MQIVSTYEQRHTLTRVVLVLRRCGCTTVLSTTSRLKATRFILCPLSVLTHVFPTPSGAQTMTPTSASSREQLFGAVPGGGAGIIAAHTNASNLFDMLLCNLPRIQAAGLSQIGLAFG